MMQHVVALRNPAIEHIKGVLDKMNKSHLVFGLQGGGCAGFEYFWLPVDEAEYSEKGDPKLDVIMELGDGKKFVVDNTALMYVMGSTIDYKSDFLSSQLTVDNPNAKGGCGCGTSISF